MTHAELLGGNALAIEAPSCDGTMVLVQVDHVCAMGDAGVEEPTVIDVHRCQRCGEFVEVSNHVVIGAGGGTLEIDLGKVAELSLALRPLTAHVHG